MMGMERCGLYGDAFPVQGPFERLVLAKGLSIFSGGAGGMRVP